MDVPADLHANIRDYNTRVTDPTALGIACVRSPGVLLHVSTYTHQTNTMAGPAIFGEGEAGGHTLCDQHDRKSNQDLRSGVL